MNYVLVLGILITSFILIGILFVIAVIKIQKETGCSWIEAIMFVDD